MAFRSAIQPKLTREESALLDICDRLEPRIATALKESSAVIMEALATSMHMDDGQTQALKDHCWDCTNSKHELIRTARVLEGEFGYLAHALAECVTWEEMLEDDEFQHLRLRWNFFRLRKEDEEQVVRTVLPVARETADRLALAWEEQVDRALTSYSEGKPDLYQNIRLLARMGAAKHVLEHLRHELLGRNSSNEREPHPHSHCAASILKTGQVHPFSRDFHEGMGYKPGGR